MHSHCGWWATECKKIKKYLIFRMFTYDQQKLVYCFCYHTSFGSIVKIKWDIFIKSWFLIALVSIHRVLILYAFYKMRSFYIVPPMQTIAKIDRHVPQTPLFLSKWGFLMPYKNCMFLFKRSSFWGYPASIWMINNFSLCPACVTFVHFLRW